MNVLRSGAAARPRRPSLPPTMPVFSDAGQATVREPRTDEAPAIEAMLRTLRGWRGHPVRFSAGPGAVASPMHRGVVSDCMLAEGGPESARVFVKHLHPEMREWVDFDRSVRAARHAASAGVAPAVLASAPEVFCVAYEYLAPPWASARLSDLSTRSLRDRAFALKARLHALPLLGSAFDPFERIVWLADRARRCRAPLPSDLDVLLARCYSIQRAIKASGSDSAFCHNDGVASNLMLGPDSGLQQVDFDVAGDCDPWFDVASTLVETCQFDSDWAIAVEQFGGLFDTRLHSRARLYGIVNDLMWGLWGCLFAEASPRKNVAFFNYAQWRLLRCRQSMARPAFEHWLRSV